MKQSLILFALLSSSSFFADDFAEFQKQQNTSFNEYQEQIQSDFSQYQKAHDEAFKEFSEELGKKWPQKEGKSDISTKSKFVEYSEDLNSKKSIDYKNNNITLEVIANTDAQAKKKIQKMFASLLTANVKEAYAKDLLEKKIVQKLQVKKPIVASEEPLVGDVVTLKEKQRMIDDLQKQDLIVVKHNDNFIYKANVQLPSNTTIRKAKTFKKDIIKNASTQKIPAELIYAIMHSESSFNPMARSHIPAYGLMQIVPKSAGVDSYLYLYNEKKVLSSAYLYNSSHNITIGAAYLHILYYRYLKDIKDPQSRFYCTIAAYNTGAGNVARTFIGTNNIKNAAVNINTISSDEVYQKLISSLPYNETRVYLKKVNNRVSAYDQLLKTTL